MSKNTAVPMWSLGSKYSRVSIMQEILPKSNQKRSCTHKSSRYLNPDSQKTCLPFPCDKFSARRLPALPELCQKYFGVVKEGDTPAVKSETHNGNNVTLRLPTVRRNATDIKHGNRATKSQQHRRVGDSGSGSITYEDDWTYARLSSSQDMRSNKANAPLLKHYWNISGEERQRIIACPQHNLIMNTNTTDDPAPRSWRVPARAQLTSNPESVSSMLTTTQRLIKTAESLQGSTPRLLVSSQTSVNLVKRDSAESAVSDNAGHVMETVPGTA